VIHISEIVDTIRTYSPDADVKPVMTAYLLAARAHAAQVRKSGEPYLSHPLAVAKILADTRMDVETIATALLHDALEDNPVSVREDMERDVGKTVTRLVDGVTKIGKLKFRSQEELAAENFRKMMLAMSQDIRVILVKLADRLHNMQTLEHHKPEKRKTIALETQEIFVPIANRLGLDRFKTELEDLCLAALEPEAFGEIEAFLERTQADREEYTARVVAALEEQLEAQGIDARVRGRAKHKASIWRKMKSQGIQLDDVPDLLAFRVIVKDVGSCYAALGLVHSAFPPIPDRIKDYIARPKTNGYQSLHTTVIGPEGRRIEVQIRTDPMNRIADEGIAAHWAYKEGHLALAPEDVLKISKIRELFESARDAEDATEFMERVKVEFYADEVFVFTPRGDIKRLPLGATALDFAFAVHTDVGMRCTGAKVNGRMVPLRYEVKSGDTLEVLTSPHQKPNRDWLQIARTGRALEKIRRVLRQEERDQGVKLGRELLESELRKYGWSLERLKRDAEPKEALKKRGYKDLDSALVDMARGHVAVHAFIRDALPEEVQQQKQAEDTGTLATLFRRFRSRAESPVLISGEDGVLVGFARCCNPLPGEPIVGFITRGRGITVHRTTCAQLAGLEADRQVPVQWDPTTVGPHSGEIEIVCAHRPGMLANITKVCEQNQVNIQRAEAKCIADDRALCQLQIAVRDIGELTRLIRNIEKISGVESVHRASG
jgi:GTP diphosphokinase / guanosine-3',5'-bis(diphosphate) 3'-diphosphatase